MMHARDSNLSNQQHCEEVFRRKWSFSQYNMDVFFEYYYHRYNIPGTQGSRTINTAAVLVVVDVVTEMAR